MRISDLILPVALCSLSLGVTTAHALDAHSTSPDNIREIPGVGRLVTPPAPLDSGPAHAAPPTRAFPWWDLMRAGDIEGGMKAADTACAKGEVAACWQLGHWYADGVGGVNRDSVRAFNCFRSVIDTPHIEDMQEFRAIVADTRVQLGLFYLNGIPNSAVKSEPTVAYRLLNNAAFFGNPDAQFYLGRMLLNGQGVPKDPKQGARWLHQAALKNQYEAQAKYGSLMFQGLGQTIPPDAAVGLMWLRAAGDTAPDGVAREAVRKIYDSAWSQATDNERAASEVLYEQWKRSNKSQLGTAASP
jgi:TPR repeat protein